MGRPVTRIVMPDGRKVLTETRKRFVGIDLDADGGWYVRRRSDDQATCEAFAPIVYDTRRGRFVKTSPAHPSPSRRQIRKASQP